MEGKFLLPQLLVLISGFLLRVGPNSFTNSTDGPVATVIEELYGGTLTLPCDVTPPEGDSVALILWYKDNYSEAIFTYDARRGVAADEVTTSPTEMEGRVRFHLPDPSYLSLTGGSFNDSGRYECRVDFLKAPSRTTYLQLIVVQPPKSLLLKTVKGDVVSFTVTANLGQNFRLTCIANGGYPRPSVTWSINGRIVDATWDSFNGAMTQNDLNVVTLSRDHHQGKLRCEAYNNNVTKPLQKEVVLLLNLPPEKVQINGIPDVLHSGRRYSAMCEVSGATPDPNISWTIKLKGGREQKVSKSVNLKNDSFGKKMSDDEFSLLPQTKEERLLQEDNSFSGELWKNLYKNYKHHKKREINNRNCILSGYGVINASVNHSNKYPRLYYYSLNEKQLSNSIFKRYAMNKSDVLYLMNSLRILKATLKPVTNMASSRCPCDVTRDSFRNSSSTFLRRIYEKPSYGVVERVKLGSARFGDGVVMRSVSEPVKAVYLVSDANGKKLRHLVASDWKVGDWPDPLRFVPGIGGTTWKRKRSALPEISDNSINGIESDKRESLQRIELVVDALLNDAELTCKAFSPALPNIVVSLVKNLNVHYAPHMHIRLGAPLVPNNIREGMDVYFHCEVDANPTVAHITWLLNDKIIRHSPKEGVLISKEHLVLQKVVRKWSGQLSCRGSNGVAAGSSTPFQLKIMFVPVCVNSISLVWAGIGEEVVVPCHVAAHPPNITFHWTLTNSVTQERVSPDRVIVLGLESQLRYRPEKPHDYGRLQCWAENMLGRQKEPCVVTVKTTGSPSPPMNCSVHNQTWMGFDVSCGKPTYLKPSDDSSVILVTPAKSTEDGIGPEIEGGARLVDGLEGVGVAKLMVGRDRTRYLLTVLESEGGRMLYNVTGESGKFRVTGLTPGLDYVIRVSRFNNHGKSREVILEALTLRAAENRIREDLSGKGADHTLVGTLAGVFAAFLALFSVILALYMKGRRRRKKKASDRIHLPSSASPPGAEDHFPEEGHSTTTETNNYNEEIVPEGEMLKSVDDDAKQEIGPSGSSGESAKNRVSRAKEEDHHEPHVTHEPYVTHEPHVTHEPQVTRVKKYVIRGNARKPEEKESFL